MIFREPPLTEQNTELCPYRVLGVRRDATLAEIRVGYRRLALLHHPCRGLFKSPKSYDEAKYLKFTVIAASFETLSKVTWRRRYDKIILNAKKEVWDDSEILRSESLPSPENDERYSVSRQMLSCSLDDEIQDQLECNLSYGPLQQMYKARNLTPFTDPFQLFSKVFNADIFKTDGCENSSNRVHTLQKNDEGNSPYKLNMCLLRPLALDWRGRAPGLQDSDILSETALMYPTYSTWTGTATTTQNGQKISKITRNFNGSTITRTETTTGNKDTNEKITNVEVTRDSVEDMEGDREEPNISNGFCYWCFDNGGENMLFDPKQFDPCVLMTRFEEMHLEFKNVPSIMVKNVECKNSRSFLSVCGPFIP